VRVFIRDLEKFERSLTAGDEKAVTKFFEVAKQRRDGWCAGGAGRPSE
jgi:hypothetical protein